MTPLRAPLRVLAPSLLLALAACGGGGGGSSSSEQAGAAAAPDTTVKPIVREPLSDADMVGLSLADLSVELPWTINKVSRDPGPAAPVSWLEEVEADGYPGFDRVVFSFSDITPFPGYRIDFLDAGASVRCGEQEKALSLAGDRLLSVRIGPATGSDGTTARVPVRTRPLGTTRFQEGGLVCDTGEYVIWAAGLAQGAQVRVMELRAPPRLVVDVR